MHHNSTNCDSSQLVARVRDVIEDAKYQLFPKSLKVTRIYDEDDVSDTLTANGGWSDLRDILLCLKMTLET
jgi:N-acetylglucosaminyltransferase II (MGAT2)